jgi:Na+/H+ antiporter NhaD/arsenite permease-like protein
MVFIRPILRANQHRKHRAHTIIFFIFLVSNIGGSLTPLGDPPLFLGFLRGVAFFWTTMHLLAPTAFLTAALLALYLAIDTWLARREERPPDDDRASGRVAVTIEGWFNVGLLVLVAGVILASGSFDEHPLFRAADGSELSLGLGPVHVPVLALLRDGVLLALAAAQDPSPGPSEERVPVGAAPGGRGALHRDLRHDDSRHRDAAGRCGGRLRDHDRARSGSF